MYVLSASLLLSADLAHSKVSIFISRSFLVPGCLLIITHQDDE